MICQDFKVLHSGRETLFVSKDVFEIITCSNVLRKWIGFLLVQREKMLEEENVFWNEHYLEDASFVCLRDYRQTCPCHYSYIYLYVYI